MSTFFVNVRIESTLDFKNKLGVKHAIEDAIRAVWPKYTIRHLASSWNRFNIYKDSDCDIAMDMAYLVKFKVSDLSPGKFVVVMSMKDRYMDDMVEIVSAVNKALTGEE